MKTSVWPNGTHRPTALVGALIVTFTSPFAVHAQDQGRITFITGPVQYATVPELLARLESGKVNASVAVTAAFEKDRLINDSTLYKGNYDRYTDAQRQEILDGVERIARGVGDKGRADNAEIEAFSVLSAVGRDPELGEVFEIPDRLLRVYELAEKDDVKRMAVRHLGEALRSSPAASPRIIDLLVSLVSQPVTTKRQGYHGTVQVVEGPVHPDDALDALLSACEAAAPVLRRLQANRVAIKHDVVRERVDSLANAGFAPERMHLSSTGLNPCTQRPRR